MGFPTLCAFLQPATCPAQLLIFFFNPSHTLNLSDPSQSITCWPQVVASLTQLLQGVPIHAALAPKVRGAVIQVRGDWKFQREPLSQLSNFSTQVPKTQIYLCMCVMYFSGGFAHDNIQEWLNLSVGYNCNAVCHDCRMMKEACMVAPSTLSQSYRHTRETFLVECLKPGPRSPITHYVYVFEFANFKLEGFVFQKSGQFPTMKKT